MGIGARASLAGGGWPRVDVQNVSGLVVKVFSGAMRHPAAEEADPPAAFEHERRMSTLTGLGKILVVTPHKEAIQ